MMKNKRAKEIIGVLVTVVLIVMFCQKLGYILRPTDTDGAFSTIETLHSYPEDSIDVIVYGSSHAYRGFDTRELTDAFGIESYNYGWNWQKLNTTTLFIKDSLRYQSPKVAFVECFFVGNIIMDSNMDKFKEAEVYYSRYVSSPKDKANYIKQCIGNKPKNLEKYLCYVLPIWQFHDNWNSLSEKSFYELSMGEYHISTRGFATSSVVNPVNIPDYDSLPQAELSEASIQELEEIMSLFEAKGTKVILYTAPYEADYSFGEALKQFAEEHDCEYIDLFEEYNNVGFDSDTDFSDIGHLNTNGSVKVADYFGEYLRLYYGYIFDETGD